MGPVSELPRVCPFSFNEVSIYLLVLWENLDKEKNMYHPYLSAGGHSENVLPGDGLMLGKVVIHLWDGQTFFISQDILSLLPSLPSFLPSLFSSLLSLLASFH